MDVTAIENEEARSPSSFPIAEYGKAKRALVNAFRDIEFDVDEIQFVPKGATPSAASISPMMEKLLEMLNDVGDTQNVYYDAVYWYLSHTRNTSPIGADSK